MRPQLSDLLVPVAIFASVCVQPGRLRALTEIVVVDHLFDLHDPVRVVDMCYFLFRHTDR